MGLQPLHIKSQLNIDKCSMDKESKELVELLQKAEVESAFKHANSMKDRIKAAEILSDFAVSLIKHLYDHDTAEQLLKKSVALNPKYAEAFFNLGVLYTEPALLVRNEKRVYEAEKAYKQAIRIRPEYAEAHYNLALLYHFQDRGEEAEIEYAVFADIYCDRDVVEGLRKILKKRIKKIDVSNIV